MCPVGGEAGVYLCVCVCVCLCVGVCGGVGESGGEGCVGVEEGAETLAEAKSCGFFICWS